MIEKTFRGQYAGFISRLIAFLIDLAIISLIVVVVTWVLSRPLALFGLSLTEPCSEINSDSVLTILETSWCYLLKFSLPIASFLVVVGYPLILWTLTGQTIGKYALGLRIVRMNGRQVTFFTSVRRLIGYVVSILFFGLGFLWILVSNQRQGWHDKIAGTSVIYVWNARSSAMLSGRFAKISDRLTSRRQPEENPPALP